MRVFQADESVIVSRETLAHLFSHEATRVFHDRLNDVNDRFTFIEFLSDDLHNYFKVTMMPQCQKFSVWNWAPLLLLKCELYTFDKVWGIFVRLPSFTLVSLLHVRVVQVINRVCFQYFREKIVFIPPSGNIKITYKKALWGRKKCQSAMLS